MVALDKIGQFPNFIDNKNKKIIENKSSGYNKSELMTMSEDKCKKNKIYENKQ